MNFDVTFEEHNEEFDVDFGETTIISGGTSIPPDDKMSDTSTNTVQNKVIKKYVDTVAASVEQWSTEQHNKLAIDLERFIVQNFVVIEKDKGLSTNDFTNEDKAKLDNSVSQEYVDNLVGDIETVLDSIISAQENLIGGAE
jgi:hypothetical protein